MVLPTFLLVSVFVATWAKISFIASDASASLWPSILKSRRIFTCSCNQAGIRNESKKFNKKKKREKQSKYKLKLIAFKNREIEFHLHFYLQKWITNTAHIMFGWIAGQNQVFQNSHQIWNNLKWRKHSDWIDSSSFTQRLKKINLWY